MKDIPWDKKYIQARHQVQIMKKSKVLSASDYILMPLDERFKSLMDLYSKLEPEWVSEYEKVERRKPKEIRTDLTSKKMIEVVNGAIGEDLLELTMAMHAANKIAHQCKFIRDSILNYYIMTKAEEGKIGWSTDNRNLYDLIEKVFDPEVKKMPKHLKSLKEKLAKDYGIGQDILDDLESKNGDDLRQIIQMQRMGFYIKDFEMDNIIEELKDRDDISYGKCSTPKRDDKGRIIYKRDKVTPKTDEGLIIDLPYYGQVCVHMKTKKSISALSDIPYDSLHVYETESVLLTDNISKAAKEYLLRKTGNNTWPDLNDIMSDLKEMRRTNPRFAHYIAVKMGATKQELDEIYSDER